MGDKSQVLEAVLKEAVDLVTDLNHSISLFQSLPCCASFGFIDVLCFFFFFSFC